MQEKLQNTSDWPNSGASNEYKKKFSSAISVRSTIKIKAGYSYAKALSPFFTGPQESLKIRGASSKVQIF